jgi:hypothetical protein
MEIFSLSFSEICFLLLLFISQLLSAQEENLSATIVSIAEQLADDETDPESVSVYIEKLHELKENPVILNSADENELSKLFFLTDFQIKALADYVRSTGKIFSVFEIANIPGFDRELTEMIIPFVSLESREIKQADTTGIKNSFLTNLSRRWSGTENHGLGSQMKILTKYRLNSKSFSAGFITEKDNGEKYFTGTPPRPDFLSAHLAMNGTGIIKKIIIGDFSARFGLGTNINTGLRTGLSLTASGYLSGGDEIKPYTSASENNFFRGVAASVQIRKHALFLYYSANDIDATTSSFTGMNNEYIESFYTSGLHDSYTTLRKKDVVRETNYGFNLVLNFSKLRIGISYTGTMFSLPVKPDISDPVDLFSFEGDRNRIATGNYKTVLGKVIMFGEFSSNLNGRTALVQGVSIHPADRLNINVLLRKYDPGYTAFHGKAPFSSSSGENTEGVFANFIFEAAKHLFLSAGCDFRNYPWLKYRCSSPSRSVNSEIRFKYLPSDSFSAEAVYSYRYAMLNGDEKKGAMKQVSQTSRSLKGIIRLTPVSSIVFTTRFEYKIVEPSGSSGMLFYQDLAYKPGKLPFSIWLRYCIFGTDDWDSRIYTYENDLLYNFSIPALSDKGTRSYIVIDWKVCRYLDLRVKYGLAEKPDEIKSERVTNDLKIQIRMWF